ALARTGSAPPATATAPAPRARAPATTAACDIGARRDSATWRGARVRTAYVNSNGYLATGWRLRFCRILARLTPGQVDPYTVIACVRRNDVTTRSAGRRSRRAATGRACPTRAARLRGRSRGFRRQDGGRADAAA